MPENKTAPAGRLYWRCRRGTKELDRVLGGYLAEYYATAGADLQHAFSELLEQQDPDIYDWLLGAAQADYAFIAIIEQLQLKFIKEDSS